MKPVIINLERTRGDTHPINFNLFSKKSKKSLTITGNTFTLSVSSDKEPQAASYIFQSSATISDDLLGKISFPISAGDSNQVGTFYYDVEMVSSGEITTILKGAIVFYQDIGK